MARQFYGQKYGRPICLLKDWENSRTPVNELNWLLQGRHFQDEFRADLYVFGIKRARRMGTDRGLIQNPNFYFFAPPPMYSVFLYLKRTKLDVN